MIRVLHIIPHLKSGGADRAAATLVRYLQEVPSLKVSLCVLNRNYVQTDRSVGITDLFALNFHGSLRRPINLLRSMVGFRKLVNRWRPDLIHSHLWPACRFSATAATGMNVQHVWHIQDTRPWLIDSSLTSRFYRHWTRFLINTQKPSMIAVSKAAASYTAKGLGFEYTDFSIVPNAVDLAEFNPELTRKKQYNVKKIPVIGLAAQFRPEKGHAFLIEACGQLRKQNIPFRLRFAGAGETLESNRKLVHSLGLDDCTDFDGLISEVPRFLSELDIFVLPSTAYEGMPLCILEAMAIGLPVIATDVAGTKEVVSNNITGLLVPPADSMSLKIAMEKMLLDRNFASQVARQGQRLVNERFSYLNLVDEVVKIYQRVES